MLSVFNRIAVTKASCRMVYLITNFQLETNLLKTHLDGKVQFGARTTPSIDERAVIFTRWKVFMWIFVE